MGGYEVRFRGGFGEKIDRCIRGGDVREGVV